MTQELSLNFSGTARVVRVDKFTAKSGKDIFTLVVETEGRFPQLVPIKVFGKLADDVSSYKPGMIVELKGQLGGRDWNGKVYGDNVARSIEVVDGNDEKSAEPPPADDSDVPF